MSTFIPQDTSILLRLKRDTQSIHCSLEERVDLLNSVRTTGSYRALLENFYGLYCPYETALQQSMPTIHQWLPDIQSRTRIEALRMDLTILGNSSPHNLSQATIPPLQTIADMFGCLYVLEGSTLGGQIISRHIHEKLNYTPDSGCAFFNGYGSNIGAFWMKFCSAIEAYSATHPEDNDAIVASATRTFQTFYHWTARDQ